MSDATPSSAAATIEALERRVWNALIAGDADADRALLAPDFVGLYPTGFADRNDHADSLASGPTVASYELSETRLLTVSDDAVLFCYRSDFRRATATGPGPVEAMYVSSLWRRRDGRWLNVFSQDTPPGEALV
jgi:hypothetical protein